MTEKEEEKEKPTQSFISLEFDTGIQEFKTIEELEKWISEERAFFGWLEAGASKDGNAAQSWNATNQWLSRLTKFINQARQHANNEGQLENIRQQITNEISQLVQQNKIKTSQSPDAIFSKNLAGQESDVVAAYAMNYLMDIDSNMSNIRALNGAYHAIQYRQGSDLTIGAHDEALKELQNSWNERLNQTHLDIRSSNEELDEEISRLRKDYQDIKESISDQNIAQSEKFKEMLEESKSELADIAKTYDEKLALQSSVSYWKDKRKGHATVMKWMGFVTVLLSILTGGAFIYAAYTLLQVTIGDIELWRLGVMLAISTFGVWITRLSAKIFVSNLHLRTDADERVTMVQTYLALLREGSGPKEEERQLILQTLFRPATSGYIRDDAPAGLYEMASSALLRTRT